MILVAVFAVQLRIFPTFGARDLYSGLEGFPYWADVARHLVLPVTTLVLITVSRGLSDRYDKHRRIARWTLPLWLYVSVTGVIVYLMLYQM